MPGRSREDPTVGVTSRTCLGRQELASPRGAPGLVALKRAMANFATADLESSPHH